MLIAMACPLLFFTLSEILKDVEVRIAITRFTIIFQVIQFDARCY